VEQDAGGREAAQAEALIVVPRAGRRPSENGCAKPLAQDNDSFIICAIRRRSRLPRRPFRSTRPEVHDPGSRIDRLDRLARGIDDGDAQRRWGARGAARTTATLTRRLRRVDRRKWPGLRYRPGPFCFGSPQEKLMKIIVNRLKPRNPFVAAARLRSAGAHRSGMRARRREAGRELRRQMDQLNSQSP